MKYVEVADRADGKYESTMMRVGLVSDTHGVYDEVA